jgi:sporulation protein YlmC with PRC-barrel domain
MEIPLNAQVECTNGVCGQSKYVLINPVSDKVTHLVVREDSSGTEYIVPIDVVSETIAGTIRLRCSKAKLKKMHPFIKTTFIEEKVPYSDYGSGSGMYAMGAYYYVPYVTPDITVQVPVEHQQIPPGELAVQRGTRVEATDGYVGHVDEFVVNPKNGHITHLVMREGHLWGQKDVIIPLSAMGDTREDTVFLKLDKQQIESLPTFPVRRRWS